jgi:hypothetical protein
MKMRRTLVAIASFALIAGATSSFAAPCKDAKGRFTKCPRAAAASATPGVVKDAKGRCHVAAGPHKGKFTKC